MGQVIKKISLEGVYVVLLIVLFITNQLSHDIALYSRMGLIVGIIVLPVFLSIRYKVINTVLLSGSVLYLTNSFFSESLNQVELLTVILPMMMFVALVANLFMVIKDFYSTVDKESKGFALLKLVYVIGAFLLLIFTIVMSYAHIYNNIYMNNPDAFYISTKGTFSDLYFSATTYFTVGYGDITPVSNIARMVSLSEMVFGYLTTCLILPTLLVAFQQVFRKTRHNLN